MISEFLIARISRNSLFRKRVGSIGKIILALAIDSDFDFLNCLFDGDFSSWFNVDRLRNDVGQS